METKGDGTFYNGVRHDTSYGGIPTTELARLDDFAWFESDLTELNRDPVQLQAEPRLDHSRLSEPG